MRFVFAALMLALCSCVTPVKNEWVNQYVGREGYFYLPPIIQEGDVKSFKRCDRVKIEGFNKYPGGVLLLVSQDGRPYTVRGFALDKDFKYNDHTSSVPLLDEYFKNELPETRKVNVKDAPAGDSLGLICRRYIWTSMTRDELHFVRGLPQKVNRTVTPFSTTEQYIYPKQGGGFEADYFYIENGKLRSWQNWRLK